MFCSPETYTRINSGYLGSPGGLRSILHFAKMDTQQVLGESYQSNLPPAEMLLHDSAEYTQDAYTLAQSRVRIILQQAYFVLPK